MQGRSLESSSSPRLWVRGLRPEAEGTPFGIWPQADRMTGCSVLQRIFLFKCMETGLLLLLPSLVWPLRVPVPLKITDAESGANLSSNSKKYPVPSGSFLSVPGDQNQALWERERWSPLSRIILANCMDVSLLCNLISGPLSPFIFQSL